MGGFDGLMYFGQQDTIFPMHMEDGDIVADVQALISTILRVQRIGAYT